MITAIGTKQQFTSHGGIAQLIRAPALQAGGPGFESLCLHQYFCRTPMRVGTKILVHEMDRYLSYSIWGELGASPDHSTK